MKVEEFLEIYKHPMSKLTFKGVKLIKADKNGVGRLYYHFIGKFELTALQQMVILENPNENKDVVLKALKTLTEDDVSLIYRKKFTRKVKYGKNDNRKWKFDYVFDFNPFNIVDYNIDKEKELMELQVLGYGMF